MNLTEPYDILCLRPLDIVTVALAITVINLLEHPDSELVQGPGS